MTCQLRPDSTYGTSIGEVEVEVEDHQVQEESLERSLGSKEGESILAWLASRHVSLQIHELGTIRLLTVMQGILVRKTRKVFCRAHKSDRVTKGGLP